MTRLDMESRVRGQKKLRLPRLSAACPSVLCLLGVRDDSQLNNDRSSVPAMATVEARMPQINNKQSRLYRADVPNFDVRTANRMLHSRCVDLQDIHFGGDAYIINLQVLLHFRYSCYSFL